MDKDNHSIEEQILTAFKDDEIRKLQEENSRLNDKLESQYKELKELRQAQRKYDVPYTHNDLEQDYAYNIIAGIAKFFLPAFIGVSGGIILSNFGSLSFLGHFGLYIVFGFLATLGSSIIHAIAMLFLGDRIRIDHTIGSVSFDKQKTKAWIFAIIAPIVFALIITTLIQRTQ